MKLNTVQYGDVGGGMGQILCTVLYYTVYCEIFTVYCVLCTVGGGMGQISEAWVKPRQDSAVQCQAPAEQCQAPAPRTRGLSKVN